MHWDPHVVEDRLILKKIRQIIDIENAEHLFLDRNVKTVIKRNAINSKNHRNSEESFSNLCS